MGDDVFEVGDLVYFSEDEGTIHREEGVGVIWREPTDSSIGYHVEDKTGSDLYLYPHEIKRLATIADRAFWRIKHGSV